MKQIAALFLLLSLGACGWNPLVISKPQMVEKAPLIVSEPLPIDQLPIEFVVITKDNFEQKIKLLEEKTGGDVVLIAMTTDGYQNLSINTAELRRYILQQQAVIIAYKRYYNEKDDTIKDGKEKPNR